MNAVESIRSDLEPLPDRMKNLAVHRGYPVPWFVEWIGGVPEFRVMDSKKWVRAVKEKLCWVCGTPLEKKFVVFVAGPMCGINRTSAEPPCHLICAQWSARNCPFLSKPQMTRRENDLPPGGEAIGGVSIPRNPGVTLLWITKDYRVFRDGKGGFLIRMGEPERVEWWALGKPATRQQVEESVAGGLPSLEAMARTEDGAMEELRAMTKSFEALYPVSHSPQESVENRS